jgi:hypothetical protein
VFQQFSPINNWKQRRSQKCHKQRKSYVISDKAGTISICTEIIINFKCLQVRVNKEYAYRCSVTQEKVIIQDLVHNLPFKFTEFPQFMLFKSASWEISTNCIPETKQINVWQETDLIQVYGWNPCFKIQQNLHAQTHYQKPLNQKSGWSESIASVKIFTLHQKNVNILNMERIVKKDRYA